jgi:hypothetical protein
LRGYKLSRSGKKKEGRKEGRKDRDNIEGKEEKKVR